MLQSPLDTLLGTRTKVRLLRCLIFLDRPVSGREAARLSNVSHIALRALDELVLAGALERTTTSGGHLYRVNESNSLSKSLYALFDAERQRYSIIMESIKTVLDQVGIVLSAAFFGSAGRGEDRPESDLDLLVVIEEDARKEIIQDPLTELGTLLRSEYAITLSPVVLTSDEVGEQLDDRNSFVAQVFESARTIYGQTMEEFVDGQAV